MTTWLDNLRKQPQPKKMRLLWSTVGAALVVLIVVWIVAQHYSAKPAQTDASFFSAFGQSVHDFASYFKK